MRNLSAKIVFIYITSNLNRKCFAWLNMKAEYFFISQRLISSLPLVMTKKERFILSLRSRNTAQGQFKLESLSTWPLIKSKNYSVSATNVALASTLQRPSHFGTMKEVLTQRWSHKTPPLIWCILSEGRNTIER